MPERDPDARRTILRRDASVGVPLRGRPLEVVVPLFAGVERLATTDGELLVLLDESELLAGTLGNTELRSVMADTSGSAPGVVGKPDSAPVRAADRPCRTRRAWARGCPVEGTAVRLKQMLHRSASSGRRPSATC